MQKFINLCPHTIHLPNGESVPPSGPVARCDQTTEHAGSWDGVPLIRRSYGEVTGLPDQQPYTLLIVSMLVRLALPERADLVSPGDLVRDAEGNIIGAANLVVN